MTAIVKEVANHVSQLLCKTVVFIHFTLRNYFRNAALTLRNIPGMRHITGQTVGTDYVRSTQACSKTCPKTSSQASEIAISKPAHLAASIIIKMENHGLERCLRKRQNAPVNYPKPYSENKVSSLLVHRTRYITIFISTKFEVCIFNTT